MPVQSGAVPRRDERLAIYRRWLETKLATIEDADDRRLIQAFGRWHLIPCIAWAAEGWQRGDAFRRGQTRGG